MFPATNPAGPFSRAAPNVSRTLVVGSVIIVCSLVAVHQVGTLPTAAHAETSSSQQGGWANRPVPVRRPMPIPTPRVISTQVAPVLRHGLEPKPTAVPTPIPRRATPIAAQGSASFSSARTSRPL
jgi:hypothetical protein